MSDNQYIGGGEGVNVRHSGLRVLIEKGSFTPNSEQSVHALEGEETPPVDDYTLDGLDDVELGETILDGDVLSYDETIGKWTNKGYPSEDTNTTYDLVLTNGALKLVGSDGSEDAITLEQGSGIVLTENNGVLRFEAIQEVVGCTNVSDATHSIYELTNSGLTTPIGNDAIARFVPTFINTLPVKIRIAETGEVYPVQLTGGGELVAGQIQSNVYTVLYFRDGVFYAEDDFTLAHRSVGITSPGTILYYTGRGTAAKTNLSDLAKTWIACDTIEEFVAITQLMPESGGEFSGPVSFMGSPSGIHIEGGDTPEGVAGDWRFNPTTKCWEVNRGNGWETIVTSKSQLAMQSVIQNVYLYAGDGDVPLPGRVTVTDNLDGTYLIRINKVDANGSEVNSNLLLEGDTVTIMKEPDGVNITGFTRFTITSPVTMVNDYYESEATVVLGSQGWFVPVVGERLMIINTLSKGGFLGSTAQTPNHDQLQGINAPSSPYQHVSEAQKALIGQVNSITVTGTGDAIVLTNRLPSGYGANGLPLDAVVEFVAIANNTGPTTISLDGGTALPILDAAGGELVADNILRGDIITLIKKANHFELYLIIAHLADERHNDLGGLNEGDYQHLSEDELDMVGRVNTFTVTGTGDAIVVTPTLPGAFTDTDGGLVDGVVFQFAIKNANTLTDVTLDFDGHGAIPLLTADDTPMLVGQLRVNDIITLRYVKAENEWRLAQLPPGAEMKTNHYAVLGTPDAIELHGTIPNAVLVNGFIPHDAIIQFIPVAENATTAVTVKLDSGSAYPVVRMNGAPIVAGDIKPGIITPLRWDDTIESWRLESRAMFAFRRVAPVAGCIYRFTTDNTVDAVPVSDLALALLSAETTEELHATIGEVGIINHVAITGTGDAIVGTNTLSDPTVNGGTVPVDYLVEFVATADNTAATTFQLGNGPALPVQLDNVTALVGGELVAGNIVRLAYKTSYWLMTQLQVQQIFHTDLQNPNADPEVQHLTGAQVAMITEVNKVTVGGTGDAITVTTSIPDPALVAGTPPENFVLEFVPIANNTGATTLALHGHVKPVKKADGSELTVNTLYQDVIAWVIWKTDHWVVTNPKAGTVNHDDLGGLNAGNYQHLTPAEKAKIDQVNTTTVTGTGSALKVTNSFPDGYLVGGNIPTDYIVRFVTPVAALANCTFAMDSKAALPIKTEAGANVAANAFLAGDLVELVYKGTYWLFLPAIEGAVAHNSTTGLNTGNYIHLTTAERNTVGKANSVTVAGTGDAVTLTSKLPGTYFTYGGTVITDGTIVHWVVKAVNTIANVTINLDANGAKPLLNWDGTALEVGYLVVGDTVTMRYAGGKWYLIRTPAPVMKENFLTCTGTAANVILTSSVPGSLLVGATIPVGRIIEFVPIIDNAGATTLELDGAVAVPIVHKDGSATVLGDIVAGLPMTLMLRADGSWQIEGGAMIAMRKMDGVLNHVPLFTGKNSALPTYISQLAQRFNACSTQEQMQNILGITPEGEAYVSDYETHEYLGAASGAKLVAYRPLGRNGYQYRAELAKKDANVSNYVMNMMKSPYDSTPLSEGNEVLKTVDEYPVVVNEFGTLSFVSEPDMMLNDYPQTTNTGWVTLNGWTLTRDESQPANGALGDLNDGNATSAGGYYYAENIGKGVRSWTLEFPGARVFKSIDLLYTCGIWPGNFVNVKYVNDAGEVVYVDIDCKGGNRTTTGIGYVNSMVYHSQYIDEPIRKLVFECDTDKSTEATSGHNSVAYLIAEIGAVITYPLSTAPRVLLLADGNYYTIGREGLTLVGAAPDWTKGCYNGHVHNAWVDEFTNVKLVCEFSGTLDVTYGDPTRDAGSGVVYGVDHWALPLGEFRAVDFESAPTIIDDYPVENTSWTELNGWKWTANYTGNDTNLLSEINDGVQDGKGGTFYGVPPLVGVVRMEIEFPEERVFESISLLYSRGMWPGNFVDVEYIDNAGEVVYTDVNFQGGSVTAVSTSPKDVVYTSQYRGLIKKLVFVCDTDQCTSATSGYAEFGFLISEIGYLRTSYGDSTANALLFADGNYYAIEADTLTLIGPDPDWDLGVNTGTITDAQLKTFDSAALTSAQPANISLTYSPLPTATDGTYADVTEHEIPVVGFSQLGFDVTLPAEALPRVLVWADGKYYQIDVDKLTEIGDTVDWTKGVTNGVIENAWVADFAQAKLVLESAGTIVLDYHQIQPQISLQKYGVNTGGIVSLTSKAFDDQGTGMKMALSKDGVEWFTFDGVDTFTSLGALTVDTVGANRLLTEGFDKVKYDAMTVAMLSTWMGIGVNPTQFLFWAYATNNPEAIVKTNTLTVTHEAGYVVQAAAAFTYFRDRAEVAAPAAGDYIININ